MSRSMTIAAALAVAALGIAVLAAAFDADGLVVLRAWLVAAHFWTALPLGASVLLLVHAITGGRWGVALGPALRAVAGAMPLAALAWAPLILAAGELFPWAGKPPEALAPVVAAKLGYLDTGFLQLRSALVLALFVGIAWAAGAWSHRPPGIARAAGALTVFGIAVTIFTVDWLLAFEPSFYSTIYPVLHGTGAVAAALALATLWLRSARGADSAGQRDRLLDCGLLMLGWSMIWLYLAFMQYLIIWSGDLPHEIHWYLVRIEGGWRLALWLAILAHVGVVAAMASPRLKARPDAVAAAAGVLLLGQAADFWWRAAPVFERDGLMAGALDLAATAGLGGLWLAAALATDRRRQRREAPHG